MIVVALLMAGDLLTWLLTPEYIRAQAESNPLVGDVGMALGIKLLALGLIGLLLTRLRTRGRRDAILIAAAICAIGILSNLRAFL